MSYKAERYDYERQAWVGTDGRWLSCSHPQEMFCQCYGRAHAGELASQPAQADRAVPSPTSAEVSTPATVAQPAGEDKPCNAFIVDESNGRRHMCTLPAGHSAELPHSDGRYERPVSKQEVAASWQGIRERLAALGDVPGDEHEQWEAVREAMRVPTINEWPAHERREYDAYQREIALVEYEQAAERARALRELELVLAAEQRGRYGQQPIVVPIEPQRSDAMYQMTSIRDYYVGGPAAEQSAADRELDARELCRSWGEWLGQAEQAERMAWDAETDEIYAAEQLERAARERDEGRNDH